MIARRTVRGIRHDKFLEPSVDRPTYVYTGGPSDGQFVVHIMQRTVYPCKHHIKVSFVQRHQSVFELNSRTIRTQLGSIWRDSRSIFIYSYFLTTLFICMMVGVAKNEYFISMLPS